jgi:hypothetical protein
MKYKNLLFLINNIVIKHPQTYIHRNDVTKTIYILPEKGWTYTITGVYKV